MPAPLLAIRGLSIERGGVPILADVEWTVASGEHWAVVGPNGCGKTVLLNAVLAYVDMGAGEVELFGKRYGTCEWQEVRKGVGLVSMGLARQLAAHERADHVVCTGAEGHLTCFAPPSPQRLARARRLLADFGIRELAARPWGVLSQGERSRVLIARALMARPRLLFLDEPATGLDPVARESYLADLDRTLRGARAPTAVLVTHHLEEIPPVITHALVMAAGRVVAAGPIATTLTSAHLSTAFATAVRVQRRAGRYRLELA